MRLAIYCLTLMTLFAGGARAEQDPAGLEQAMTCWVARDWTCAFDGMVFAFSMTEAQECRNDAHHGCSYQILALYVAGIGAAENLPSASRVDIANRALRVLPLLADQAANGSGEILFNAIRYQACKELGDLECQTKSATLIRVGLSGVNASELDFDDDELLAEYGVHYPVNLAAVIDEVSLLEPLQ